MMYFDGRMNPYDFRGVRSNRNSRYDFNSYPERDYEMDGRYGDRDYDDIDMRRRRSQTTGRYMRDRHMTDDYRLPEEDIEKWIKSLLSEMEDRDRQLFKMDSVLKRAQEMGIQFEKFTPEEFYVTVLMLQTDFSKAIGSASLDTYLKMAKGWLCDPDAALRYGKKLAAYYEYIVNEF